MRLHRLDLARYGHLTDVTLEFPGDARLHVVHGANEAGKSTALAAIADALFGFGHRTDFDFLHGAPQLRVGFTLSARDGAVASFVRRKGRRDTLRDAADRVVPEDALRGFLGGVGREHFERSFGLDGRRLRDGAQELLRLGGEAGESLLAGTGLLNLRAALLRLEDDARSLVGDGRGRRRLSDAVEVWRRMQRELDERAVAPRAWQEAEASHAATVAELADVQERIRTLTEENHRLQRVRRIAPLLAQLADARESLAGLADAPHLPADADVRFQALSAARRDAGRDQQREAEDAQSLILARAALPQDAPALAVQDAIDALSGRVEVVRNAGNDLPNVRADVAARRARVADAIGELGLDLEPEAARDALPPATARRTVQRLVTQHAALSTRADTAKRQLAAGQQRRDQAAAALAAVAEPADPTLLRRSIEAVRGEGRLDADLAQAQLALDAAEANAGAALAALPLWAGDMAGLITCKLPLSAEAERAAAQLDAATQAYDRAQADAAEIDRGIAATEEDLSLLGRGEIVPTPAAVAVARAERDRVWRILRRMAEGGAPTDDTPVTALPDTFEALRDEADRLADRRADEAKRVSDYLDATARLAVLRGREATAEAVLRRAEQMLGQAEAIWRTLWAHAGVTPLAPPAMLEWRRSRADVLRLADTAASARLHRDDLAARHDRARAALTALLVEPPTAGGLDVLLLAAETICAASETAGEAHRALRQALVRGEEQLPDLRQAANAATMALDAWQGDWSGAVAALALPANPDIDMAETALAAWARIAEDVPAWRTDEGRVADMTAAIDAFAAAVAAVRDRLGEPRSDEPAPSMAAQLGRRLADARKAAADADNLGRRIAIHQEAATEAARRHAAAETELDALRRLAGVADDDGLAQAIERARKRDALAEAAARIEQEIRAQGDGLPEAVLRAEAAATEPDAVVGRLATIEGERSALGDRREELSATRARAEATLRDMRAGHDAADVAQKAEDALADARAAAERYARLHVARVLLRAGIERFRRQQQDPMLRAAGAHFALLTGGRYERLVVDHDAAGRTVMMAIRDTGAECPMEALSEGARDQLYLALRTAAIEDHTARLEPLPFIADDLLVQFDDARAAAAIALLAELGRSTQVILFTHHGHIAALAGRQAGVAVQTISPATVTLAA